MKNARETIYAAVFAKFSGLLAFNLAQRGRVDIQDIRPEACPAIYMELGHEVPEVRQGLPTKWTLHPTFFIAVQGSDGATTQGLLNSLKDGIETALKPDSGITNDCTLGNLVSHCRIGGGSIEHWEGVNDPFLAVMMIPLEIVTI